MGLHPANKTSLERTPASPGAVRCLKWILLVMSPLYGNRSPSPHWETQRPLGSYALLQKKKSLFLSRGGMEPQSCNAETAQERHQPQAHNGASRLRFNEAAAECSKQGLACHELSLKISSYTITSETWHKYSFCFLGAYIQAQKRTGKAHTHFSAL